MEFKGLFIICLLKEVSFTLRKLNFPASEEKHQVKWTMYDNVPILMAVFPVMSTN